MSVLLSQHSRIRGMPRYALLEQLFQQFRGYISFSRFPAHETVNGIYERFRCDGFPRGFPFLLGKFCTGKQVFFNDISVEIVFFLLQKKHLPDCHF